MDKQQLLNAFNDHFLQFVTDVQTVFPDNIDIATIHTSFTKLRKANPRLLVMAFKEHVSGTYREEIQKGDIAFFIENDYKSFLSDKGINAPNVILEKIDCLRAPVRQMNGEDQAKVIKYLQNLMKLSDMYALASGK